jgi:putative ABC transport system permease protein
MTLVIATAGRPLALTGPVRAIVRQLERDASLARVRSMEQVVDASVASRRFVTRLLAGFAALALGLAGIGIFGVISYGVTQRTFELGLRIALGAPRGRVLGLVVAEGVRLTAIGLGIGTLAAVAVTRLLRSMFVEVTPTDPITIVSVATTILVVTLAASWIPGRRAMAVDPMGAMRTD